MLDFIVEKAHPELVEILKDVLVKIPEGIIAGGAIRNFYELLNDQKVKIVKDNYYPKDIDVFFRNEQDMSKFYAQCKTEDEISYDTLNSFGIANVTMDFLQDVEEGFNIDCVKVRFGDPIDIISSFDFTVAQAAFFQSDGTDGYEQGQYYTAMHKNFKQDVIESRLCFTKISPTTSHIFERVYRYTKYGYIINGESAKKCIEAALMEMDFIHRGTVDDFVSRFYNKNLLKELRQKGNKRYFPSLMETYVKILQEKNVYSNSLLSLLIKNNDKHNSSLVRGSLQTNSSVQTNFERLTEVYLSSPVGRWSNLEKEFYQSLDVLDTPDHHTKKSVLKQKNNVDPSAVIFNDLMKKKKHLISDDVFYRIMHFAYSMHISDENFLYDHCHVHYNIRKDNIRSNNIRMYEAIAFKCVVESLNEHSIDYILMDTITKSFMIDDSDEWFVNTCDFWLYFINASGDTRIRADKTVKVPDIHSLRNLVLSKNLETSIPPHLIANLLCD